MRWPAKAAIRHQDGDGTCAAGTGHRARRSASGSGVIALSRNELPGDGDWTAVYTAVHRQLKKLDISIARLSRESGVSENTIRYIGRAEKRQRSTLVALSAALGFPYGYLADVLRGAASPEVPPRPAADMAAIENLLRAELGSVRARLDTMGKTLHAVDEKTDVLADRRRREHAQAAGKGTGETGSTEGQGR